MTKKKKIEVYDINDVYTPLDPKECFDVVDTPDGDLWIPRQEIRGLQIRPPRAKGQSNRYVAIIETMMKEPVVTGVVGWDGGAESIDDWAREGGEEE